MRNVVRAALGLSPARAALALAVAAFAAVGALALASTAQAHEAFLETRADCDSGWYVAAVYDGDPDRRVVADVMFSEYDSIDGDAVVAIDQTGYMTGDRLFSRSGTGSVDAFGLIQVFRLNHDGEWEVDSETPVEFSFDSSECVVATPTPGPPPVITRLPDTGSGGAGGDTLRSIVVFGLGSALMALGTGVLYAGLRGSRQER